MDMDSGSEDGAALQILVFALLKNVSESISTDNTNLTISKPLCKWGSGYSEVPYYDPCAMIG